jgi:hypothetical protein
VIAGLGGRAIGGHGGTDLDSGGLEGSEVARGVAASPLLVRGVLSTFVATTVVMDQPPAPTGP